MKIIPLLATIFIAFTAFSQSQPTTSVLSVDTFNAEIKATEKAVVLDVRTPQEYNEGFIANAVNVDYKNENFKTEVSKLDTSAAYFVYCRTGVRSASASNYMRSIGFTKAFELQGGITAWKEKKLPIVIKSTH